MRSAKARNLTLPRVNRAGVPREKARREPVGSAPPTPRRCFTAAPPLRTSSWMASMKPLSAPRWSWNCPRTKPDLSAYSTSCSMYSVSRSAMTGRRSFAFARARTRALLSQSSDALLLRCSDAEVGQDRASGVDRPSTFHRSESPFMRADGNGGGYPRNAGCPHACRPGSCRCRHGPASPGCSGCPRRGPACGRRNSAAARGAKCV